jgi:DNA polymerase I
VHPAACLRHGDSFPSLVRDVGKLVRSDIYVGWEEPKYRVFDDSDTARAAMRQLATRPGHVSVDIEVGVDKDASFTHPDVLLCVGLGYDGNRAIVIGERALRDDAVKDGLRRLLRAKDTTYQNGKFDEQVLIRLGILKAPTLGFDTMLANYCLDERPGYHSLEAMASEYLGAPNWKGELDKYKGKNDSYAVIPRKVLYRYNAWDATQTHNLRGHLEPKLDKNGMRDLHDRLVGYSKELIYIELDGVAIDLTYNEQLTEESLEYLAALEEKLQPYVANPRSPKQVGETLKRLGIGARDTREETLQNAFERATRGSHQYRFLGLMLLHRKAQKEYGTYVKGIRKRLHEGRIYTTYLLHGSVTGRLASRNPNMQNQPRGSRIRKQFVPDEGNIFVQGDYRTAELRVIACEARDEYLRGVLSDPERDIHGEVAERFFGSGWNKEQRVRAKAVVFGLPYGREAASLATEFKLPMAEAERYHREFFAAIPDVARWREEVVKAQIFGGRALQTHWGRKRRFWLITKENKKDVEKEGYAFIPQSTANDICLSSLRPLREAFGSAASAPRLRFPVHDSLGVECRIDDEAAVAETMRDIMPRVAREQYSDFVPFPVDVQSGSSWGELDDTGDA